MTDDEIVRDLADAVMRLSRAMEKHGLAPPKAIMLANPRDVDRMRSLQPSDMVRFHDDPQKRPPPPTICGVQFLDAPESRDAAGARVVKLREALAPFAKLRLSHEAEVTDLLYRTPAAQMLRSAEAIEQRDAEILAARQALKDVGDVE